MRLRGARGRGLGVTERREHAVERLEVRLCARHDDVGVGAVAVEDGRRHARVLSALHAPLGGGAHAHCDLPQRVDPLGHRPDGELEQLGGRVDERVDRLVRGVDRSRSDRRLHLDEPNRDKQWLIDQALGHMVFEEATVDALELFWPTDVSGNVLLCEPMRLLRAESLMKQKKDGAWGESALDWEIQYLLNVNQAVQ